MRRYLLDTPLVSAYLQGRQGALELVNTWIASDEVVTSILVYGEVVEYLKDRPNFSARRSQLVELLNEVIEPYFLSYEIMERYADISARFAPSPGARTHRRHRHSDCGHGLGVRPYRGHD